MSSEYIINDLEEIKSVAKSFAEDWLSRGSVFAFYAPMGTGKTTFIKAICEYLSVEDAINSPTFSIVNEYYSSVLDDIIYHFDCYRLASLSDAINLCAEDYIHSGRLMFIEWPDIISDILPEDIISVCMKVLNGEKRCIYVSQRI